MARATAETTRAMTAGQKLEAAENPQFIQEYKAVNRGDKEPARLKADIAQTRAEIEDTLEALEEKLSPAAIKKKAKTAVRDAIHDATIGKVEEMVHTAEERVVKTGHSMMDTIRNNPIPAALAGIGLVWLYMSRRNGRTTSRDVERSIERERKEGETAQQVGQMVERAGHSIEEAAHGAGRAMSSFTKDVGRQGRRLENRLERVYYDNPLAAGAIMLATGTAIGLAIPISRKEDEWMGSARDQLVEKVSEMAQGALGKVEEAVGKEGGNGSRGKQIQGA